MLRRATILVATLLCSATAADRLKKPSGEIVDVPTASVPYALQQGYTRPKEVYFRKPNGDVQLVYEDDESAALDHGWWLMSDKEVADYEAKQPSVLGRTVEEHGRDVMLHLWEISGVVAVGGVAIWLAMRKRYPGSE